jgi:4-oxalocrotonate tautomerase
MPLIEVKMIEKVFTPAQKKEIITKLTDALVEIEGEALRPYTVVLLEDVRSGSWGVGGNGLTTEDVLALQGQKKIS